MIKSTFLGGGKRGLRARKGSIPAAKSCWGLAMPHLDVSFSPDSDSYRGSYFQ